MINPFEPELVVAAPISSTAQVGADAPAHAQAKAAELTELLTRADAAPAGWRFDTDTLFLAFYTPFRRNRAIELIRPPSYQANGRTIFVATELLGDDVTAAVGQIVGTAQETPWTCGPAALRAVLAHYGRDVTEAEVERAAVNGPAIGARPEGMVRAAEVYGCHAKAFVMNSVGELVELLARRVPPIAIVDSWTRPGKVGHYVVVSRISLTRGLVTVMDPHTEGNWRVMTVKEFDERWWAKRRGKDGESVIVRRIAVVVTPGEGMVVVGADKSPVVAPAVVLPDVRGDIPSARVQRGIVQQVERLIRNDMSPLWVEHKIENVSAGTVTFVFATGFRAGRARELLPVGLRIEGRALKIRTRVFDPDVELGGDAIWPALQRVIDKHSARLALSNVAPVEVEYDWRTVTFLFDDVTAESVVKAGDILPRYEDVDGKRIYFKTRTIGRDVDMGAEAETEAEVQPSHGRTAKCSGPSKRVALARKVTLVWHKIGITIITSYLTGGAGRKELIAESEKLLDDTRSLAAGELRLWFNTASNADVIAWGFAKARERMVHRSQHPNDAETKLFTSGGVTSAALNGDPMTTLVATFAYWFLVDPFSAGDQVKLHIMQAIAIVLYGGKGAVAVLNAALQTAKQKRNATGLASVLAALKRYSDAQGARVAATASAAQIGAEAVAVTQASVPTTHGRTANLVYKGMPKWSQVMGKITDAAASVVKAAFAYETGGKSKGLTNSGVFKKASDQLIVDSKTMSAKEFATWLNNATNEEVAALHLGLVGKKIKEEHEKKSKMVPRLDRLDLTDAVFNGPLDSALIALLRLKLIDYGNCPFPPQQTLHVIQAIAILLYGSPDVLPLIDARLKVKPKFRKFFQSASDAEMATWTEWANATLEALKKYSESRAVEVRS